MTTTMTVVDGTDALAFVIIRPGSQDNRVAIEAAANGIGKRDAATVLRHVADQWTAEEPAPDFPATWAGGHALVIGYGDEELSARCQCGEQLGTATPDKPLDHFATPWERHVMALGH